MERNVFKVDDTIFVSQTFFDILTIPKEIQFSSFLGESVQSLLDGIVDMLPGCCLKDLQEIDGTTTVINSTNTSRFYEVDNPKSLYTITHGKAIDDVQPIVDFNKTSFSTPFLHEMPTLCKKVWVHQKRKHVSCKKLLDKENGISVNNALGSLDNETLPCWVRGNILCQPPFDCNCSGKDSGSKDNQQLQDLSRDNC